MIIFAQSVVHWMLAEIGLSFLFLIATYLLWPGIKHPSDRYTFLRAIFAALLFLPWLKITHQVLPTPQNFGALVTGLQSLPRELPSGVDWERINLALALGYVILLLGLAIRRFNAWLQLRELGLSAEVTQVQDKLVFFHDQDLPPMVVGWFHPKILIPRCLIQSLKPDELRAVLAHEAIHLRRNDPAFNALRLLVRDILWFSPFVWLLASRFEEEMELSVDNLVLRESGITPRAYGGLLVQLALQTTHSGALAGPFLSNAFLKRRILVMKNKNHHRKPRFAWLAIVLSTGLALGGLSALGLNPNAVKSEGGLKIYLVDGKKDAASALTAKDFASASVPADCQEKCPVTITLKPEAAKRFAQLTGDHLGKAMNIEFQGKVLASPVIKARINSGRIMVTDSFSPAQAAELAKKVNEAPAP